MKVYILEDEINILKYILTLISDIPYLKVVGHAADTDTPKREIPLLKPDLILADIQLKNGTSFSVFSNMETTAQVIFITAYEHYAIQALNMGAFAYLLKPLDTADFKVAIERCYKKIEDSRLTYQQLKIAESAYSMGVQPQRIVLKSTEYMQIIAMDDIRYCKSDKGYTTFFLKNGQQIIVSKVLKEYENLLPAGSFIRCHQSYIVNSACMVRYFKDGEIELDDATRIPVSDRKREIVLNYIYNL